MDQKREENGFCKLIGASSRPQVKNVTDEEDCKGHFEHPLGQTVVATSAALENFGERLWEEGDLRQAKLMFEKARKGFEEFLGPSHHDTLRLVLLVGIISCITGTKDQAIEMLDCVNTGMNSLQILQRAILKNHWIRYQKVLQNEHKRAWKTYLEIKESLGINFF